MTSVQSCLAAIFFNDRRPVCRGGFLLKLKVNRKACSMISVHRPGREFRFDRETRRFINSVPRTAWILPGHLLGTLSVYSPRFQKISSLTEWFCWQCTLLISLTSCALKASEYCYWNRCTAVIELTSFLLKWMTTAYFYICFDLPLLNRSLSWPMRHTTMQLPKIVMAILIIMSIRGTAVSLHSKPVKWAWAT